MAFSSFYFFNPAQQGLLQIYTKREKKQMKERMATKDRDGGKEKMKVKRDVFRCGAGPT